MKAILCGHVLKNYKLMWLLPVLLSKVRNKGSPHLIPKLLEIKQGKIYREDFMYPSQSF